MAPEATALRGGTVSESGPTGETPPAERGAAASRPGDAPPLVLVPEVLASSAPGADSSQERRPPEALDSSSSVADTGASIPAVANRSSPRTFAPLAGTAEAATPGGAEETPGGSLSPRAAVVVPLSEVQSDGALKLRPEGDVDALATSIARLGQLFPVEVRRRSDGRYEVICGFRRVAALRLLKRERLLARVHSGLSDADALLIAVTDLLQQRPPPQDELVAARERLEAQGLLFAPVRDALDRAILPPDETLAPELVGEGAEQQEEVELDTLAADVVERLSQVNQDLALIADLFGALDSGTQAALLEQLSYPARLRAYLTGE